MNQSFINLTNQTLQIDKASLRTLIDAAGGGSGGGVSSWNDLTDKPFYEGSAQLFSESVTTAENHGFYSAALTYRTAITADTLIVTFDGTEYTVSKGEGDAGAFYGEAGESGPDFTNYPFFLASTDDENVLYGVNMLYTETAGTYAIAASVPSIVTTDEFEEAVSDVVSDVVSEMDIATTPLLLVHNTTTAAEVTAAIAASRMMYLYDEDDLCHIVVSLPTDGSNGTVIPDWDDQYGLIHITNGVVGFQAHR